MKQWLHTRRLVLAPLTAQDLHALHAHWTEPDVRRYLWDGRKVTLAQVAEVIATSDWLFETHGAGLWSLRPLDPTSLIGCGGFWYFHEPPELELLLSLSSSSWGLGLAREAAEALITFAFNALDWATVQGSTDAPNIASLRLMARLGMRPAGQRPGEFGTIEVFRIGAAEWRRHQAARTPAAPRS